MNAVKRSIVMGYRMQLEAKSVYVENDFFSPRLLESTTNFKDDTVSMELNDVSLRHFHLMRGKHSAEADSTYSLDFYNSFYVSHFVLNISFGTYTRINAVSSILPFYAHYTFHS